MLYTIIVFTENSPGVLYRIADLFLRRKINIESMTVSEIEQHKMSRFTITVKADGPLVEKIVKQIYRIIEVLKVVDSTDDDLIVREVALYRIHLGSSDKLKHLNEIMTLTHATIVNFSKNEAIVSLSGSEDDIINLKSMLMPFGLKEFVRSGRIALTKNSHKLSDSWSVALDKQID